MKPGETERFSCDGCLTEFEITYEPKAKGLKDTGIEEKTPVTCPFCDDSLERA